jgi:hypothetical protein
MTPLLIANREITVKAELCLKLAPEDMVLGQLRVIFQEFLSCYKACYVTKKWECWLIMMVDNTYYLFDSIGVCVSGKKKIEQRSVLYRFYSIENLIEQLLENICKIFNNDKEDLICYSVGGILVKVDKVQCKKKEMSKKEKVKKTPVKSSRDMPVFFLKDLPIRCPEEVVECQL